MVFDCIGRIARPWLHVRPSGTEPVVRLIAEALGRSEAEELIERATAVLGGDHVVRSCKNQVM